MPILPAKASHLESPVFGDLSDVAFPEPIPLSCNATLYAEFVSKGEGVLAKLRIAATFSYCIQDHKINHRDWYSKSIQLMLYGRNHVRLNVGG